MAYNSQLHHRKSIRLKGYDYSQAAAYFITICAHQRDMKFGAVKQNNSGVEEMVLSEVGQVAYQEWIKLPGRFSTVDLDVFQIMPNHMHGIIVIQNVGAGFTPALDNGGYIPAGDSDRSVNIPGVRHRVGVNPTPTIGAIVGAYKSLVAKACLPLFTGNQTMGKIWQRNYYEHIIRNERSYYLIAEYIMNNPDNWQRDKFFTE